MVVPDILVNAGGDGLLLRVGTEPAAIYWDEEQVNRELAKRMERAWTEVRAVQQEKGIDLRRAAYVIAIDRVARAESLRGFE